MLSRSTARAYSGNYAVMVSSEEPGGSQQARSGTGARLAALITALSEAQQLADSNDLDGRARAELRNALDHIRRTASTVQQSFEAPAKSSGGYAMLSVLATQRVDRAAQLARDLSLDMENMDVTVETEGLQDLYQVVGQLHRQLGVLCKPGQ